MANQDNQDNCDKTKPNSVKLFLEINYLLTYCVHKFEKLRHIFPNYDKYVNNERTGIYIDKSACIGNHLRKS